MSDPRNPALLRMLNVPDPRWLPAELRSHATEVRELRKRRTEADKQVAELSKESAKQAAQAADRAEQAEAVRTGKAAPKIGSIARLERALTAAQAQLESLTAACAAAVSDYDLAMRDAITTAHPQAMGELDDARARYDAAIDELLATRSEWIFRRRIAATWIGLRNDPTGASASMNTVSENQSVRIGGMDLAADDITKALRTELASSDKALQRAEQLQEVKAS